MSIETISVEQFMNAIKAIICEHDTEVPDDIDEMLVSMYNEYRERVRNGESLEESLPFFNEVAEKVVHSLELED